MRGLPESQIKATKSQIESSCPAAPEPPGHLRHVLVSAFLLLSFVPPCCNA